MPPFVPTTRRKLIQSLKQAGFTGPYSGGNPQYLVKDDLKLFIPNPHTGDIRACRQLSQLIENLDKIVIILECRLCLRASKACTPFAN